MRLTLLIFLVIGSAAVLVSAQNNDRRQARARFRALAEAARNGDVEAQNILKSRRRLRPRQQQPTRSSAVPARPVFQDAVEAPVEAERPIRVRVPVRRNRVRTSQHDQEVTTFRPPSRFSATPAPEQVFPDTEETIFTTNPFTEAPVFQLATEPVTEAPQPRIEFEETSAPLRPSFRQRPKPVDDFSLNFELEPHRALNTGLEVDTRSEHIIPRFGNDRTTEPPVETIRRYSYFDEQGNYVFGYEAADGSFKEEVRGLDCVVNGKYGYVDPDGIRREFKYTSGNKCDPDAVPDPETQEVPILPLNDQFLQQTQEQQLSEAELEQIHFNRRRRPVPAQNEQPQNVQLQQQPVRRRRPQARPQQQATPQPAFRPSPEPAPQPVLRPSSRPAPQPVLRPSSRPAPQPVLRPSSRPAPRPVTPAPAPVFTTPASFSRFTTPASFRQAQEGRFPPRQEEVRPQPPQRVFPQEEQLIRRPKPTSAPAREVDNRQTTHQAFQPPEGPSFRPTPKPIAFDFDSEFNNLFSNFAGPRPTARPKVFTPAPRPAPRPTAAPTRKPPPPPPAPTARNTPQPVTQAPVTTRPPFDDGSSTLGGGSNIANQLVFDSASGTFTNVPVKTASSGFLPKPAPNPFAPRPTQAASRPPTLSNPTQPPSSPIPFSPSPRPSTVGRPLPLPTQPAAFNPANHFVINQNGRSPAAAEFDKFFSQFNLKF